jgi:hypothetical protein
MLSIDVIHLKQNGFKKKEKKTNIILTVKTQEGIEEDGMVPYHTIPYHEKFKKGEKIFSEWRIAYQLEKNEKKAIFPHRGRFGHSGW